MNKMPRLLNLMHALRGQKSDDGLSCEGELLLAFVSDRCSKDITTTVSDLVRSGFFGAPPTAQRNVNKLVKQGMLDLYRAPGEYRKVSLKLSSKAEEHMVNLEKLVHSVCWE